MNKKINTEKVLTIGTIVFIFVAWTLSTKLGKVNPMLVPSPESVWEAFQDILKNGYKDYTLLQHLSASLGRLLAAFLVSA